MKIYQTDTSFVHFDNEVLCTINARVELYTGTHYFVVQGKAKCHPDDKFDPELGKRIAESRAASKLYLKIYKVIKIQIIQIQKNQQILKEEMEKVFKIAFQESTHHCKLLR